MLCRLLMLLLLVALPLPLAAAAPVKARSLSGTGLLLLRSQPGENRARLTLYREPGLGRVAELDAAQLPPITPALQTPDGLPALIVTAKKLDWYRIVYDHGERQAWLHGRPVYLYRRWEELLPGRQIVLAAGLKKEYYALRSSSEPAGEPLQTVGRETVLTVIRVAGDWVNVRQDATLSGWLRWRDDNGRLLIAVGR